MLKKNKGKISFIILFINILLILYFANNYENTKSTTIALNISKDVTVSDTVIADFQNTINSHNYNNDDLQIIENYNWYFTTTSNLNNFSIEGDKITINANNKDIGPTTNQILNKIIGEK